MKFVEPKVVDSLSENGLLLAQDGDDVVKIPVGKLIIPNDGNNDGVIIIDVEDEGIYTVEFGNKVVEALQNGVTIYIRNTGMLGEAFSVPVYFSLREIHSTGRTEYSIQLCYYGYAGSSQTYCHVELPCDPPMPE